MIAITIPALLGVLCLALAGLHSVTLLADHVHHHGVGHHHALVMTALHLLSYHWPETCRLIISLSSIWSSSLLTLVWEAVEWLQVAPPLSLLVWNTGVRTITSYLSFIHNEPWIRR